MSEVSLTLYGSDPAVTLDVTLANNRTADDAVITVYSITHVLAGQNWINSTDSLTMPLYLLSKNQGSQVMNLVLDSASLRVGNYSQTIEVTHDDSAHGVLDAGTGHYTSTFSIFAEAPAEILVADFPSTTLLEGSSVNSSWVLANKAAVADQLLTVTVSLIDESVGEGATLSVTTLEFSDATWSYPQFVTLSARNDAFAEETRTFTITYSVVATDPDYAAQAVMVNAGHYDRDFTILEDDVSGIEVVVEGDSEFVEGRDNVTVTMTLLSEPLHTVSISMPTSTAWEITPTSHEWTSRNWDRTVSFVIVSPDDSVIDGLYAGVVNFAGHPTVSNDSVYDGVLLDSISVTIYDDDIVPDSMNPRFGYSGESQYVDISFNNTVSWGTPYPAHVECQFGDHEFAYNESRVIGAPFSTGQVRCPIPDCILAQRLGRLSGGAGACYTPVNVYVLVSEYSTTNYSSDVSHKQVSELEPALEFHYADLPVVTEVEPVIGDMANPTEITVRGDNFRPSDIADFLEPHCVIGGQTSSRSFIQQEPNSNPAVYELVCVAPARSEFRDAIEPELVNVEVMFNGQIITNDQITFGYLDYAYFRQQDAWLFFYILFYGIALLWVLGWTAHFYKECCAADEEEEEEEVITGPLMLIRGLEAKIEKRRADNAEIGLDENGDPMTEQTIEWYVSEADMSLRQKGLYRKKLQHQLNEHRKNMKAVEKAALERKQKSEERAHARERAKRAARGEDMADFKVDALKDKHDEEKEALLDAHVKELNDAEMLRERKLKEEKHQEMEGFAAHMGLLGPEAQAQAQSRKKTKKTKKAKKTKKKKKKNKRKND